MRNNLSKLISRVSVWRRTRRSIHEEPGQGDEVDEKNDQIALGIPDDADQCSRAWRIAECVAGREILRNDERNSNSPETGRPSRRSSLLGDARATFFKKTSLEDKRKKKNRKNKERRNLKKQLTQS